MKHIWMGLWLIGLNVSDGLRSIASGAHIDSLNSKLVAHGKNRKKERGK